MSPLLEPLAEFKTADLPKPPSSFWKLAGPGAVLVGLSIGAGEIIVWPRTVAQYGAGMVWAAMLGVFLQMWVNFEIGRWTIATGETVYTGFTRVWRGFAPLFILFNVLGWLAPAWAMASGSALKALLVGPEFGAGTFWGSNACWTTVTFAAAGMLLFGPKMVYHTVEKTIEILIVIVTVGLIIVAVAVGTADRWKELGAGAVNFGYRAEGVSARDLFTWIVFAGAGGTSNLFYTFYLRDKNLGMGALIPDMQNPLRGRAESIPSTGFQFAETAENQSRFRTWLRYVRQDQMLFFWLLNSVTLLLFIFGALAVLHPQGIVPEKGTLIWDQSLILGKAFGRWGAIWGSVGRTIFLLVGVATLFSTQLALIDGVSRSISDIIYTNVKPAQKRPLSWWYMLIAVAWMATGCGIAFAMDYFKSEEQELGILLQAAYMGGFAMAVYVPLMLYINLRYLPKSARPGAVSIIMMLGAAVLYGGFAVMSLWGELQSRFG
ncbi:MAG TPA: Nramp family divalent metal transporter [Pirellulales bacterium]|nr:Nramp family divalent metal transporter [Pirellulales bacterium]